MDSLSVPRYRGQEKKNLRELIVRAIRQRHNVRSTAHPPSVADGPFRLVVYMQALERQYGRCVPANRKMAEHFDVSVRTIQRWKRELESAGLIRQERRKRPHHREQRSAYHILVDSRKCCTRQLASSNEMSSMNVTPSVPLRGTSCSNEQQRRRYYSGPEFKSTSRLAASREFRKRTTNPSGGQKGWVQNSNAQVSSVKNWAPTEAEIAEVRRDWGKVPIDRNAMVRILSGLKNRGIGYADFRRVAAQRVRQYQPLNRIGFVIRLAETGEIFAAGPRALTFAEELDAVLQRERENDLRRRR